MEDDDDFEEFNLEEEHWAVVTEHLFCVLRSLKAEGYSNLDILKAVSFIMCDLTQSMVGAEDDKLD